MSSPSPASVPSALLTRKPKPKKKATRKKGATPSNAPSAMELEAAPIDDGHQDDLFDQLDALDAQQDSLQTPEPGAEQDTLKQPRRNRHKEKLKRREEAFEQAREQARQEASNSPDLLQREAEAMQALCDRMRVKLVQMPPDGNCLFAAIAHQLAETDPSRPSLTYEQVRLAAAQFMQSHKDDFIFFLPSEESQDGVMTDAQFQAYCERIASTAEWGGQPEILAMSKHFQVPIQVLQTDGQPIVKVGEDEFPEATPIRISYHRHQYASGEHYNSVVDATT